MRTRRAARDAGLLLVAVLSVAVAAACDKSDSVVIVKVDADSGISGVVQLRAFVSNGGEGETRVFPTTPGAAAIAFPTSFSLSVPRARTGALDVALDGIGDGGAAVAAGAGSVDLGAGENVTVMITLHAGPSTCGNGQIDDGETCDDGDRYSNGACDYVCQDGTGGPGTGGGGGAAGSGGRGGGGVGGTAGRGGAGGGGAGGSSAAGRGGAGAGGTGGGAAGSGGRPCMIELLTSGGFDGSNTRWTQVTNGTRMLIYDQANVPSFVPAPQTPTRLAWLGYDVVSMKPAIRQNIQVPADAIQLVISGYYQIQTDESGCTCDYARVQLDVGGNLMDLTEWSAQNANTDWAFFGTFVDLSTTPIAGQTVAFQIQADMDGGANTSFYFDSLSVIANVCP